MGEASGGRSLSVGGMSLCLPGKQSTLTFGYCFVVEVAASTMFAIVKTGVHRTEYFSALSRTKPLQLLQNAECTERCGQHDSTNLYQFQFEMALHRVFTLRENTLLIGLWTRYFKLERVLGQTCAGCTGRVKHADEVVLPSILLPIPG